MLDSVVGGEPGVSLNVTGAELLADSVAVAAVIATALDSPGAGVRAHWRVQDLFRQSGAYDDIVNALSSPNPVTRMAAARLCGAMRLTESVSWIGDLLDDANPKVRDAAVRALTQLGGRRAVERLVEADGRVPVYRLAIALSRAASDIDIEALMRQPRSERAAVATVLACGLRRDVLRIPPLLGIAQDRRWPRQVRLAACKALGIIRDASAAEVLGRLGDSDPDPTVRAAAGRARRRVGAWMQRGAS